MINNPPEAVFIDSNIWLYALITGQDPTKSVRAKQIITAHTGTQLAPKWLTKCV